MIHLGSFVHLAVGVDNSTKILLAFVEPSTYCCRNIYTNHYNNMSGNNTTTVPAESQEKQPYTDWMSPEARRMLRRLAKADGHTMSEYLERMVRKNHLKLFGQVQ